MSNEQEMPLTIGFGIFAGITTAVLIHIVVAWLLWQIFIPFKMAAFKDNLVYWSAMTLNDLFPPLMQSMANQYRSYLQHMPSGLSANAIHIVFYVAEFIGTVVGAYIGYLAGKAQQTVRQVKGRQLIQGNEKIQLWLFI